MTLIAGVDPGLSGAIAVFDSELGEIVQVLDLPTLEIKRGKSYKRQLDIAALDDMLNIYCPRQVLLEDVWGQPSDSGSSGFSFGKACGIIEALLFTYKLSVSVVSPAKWKKALGVNSDKDGARFRASQLMPGSAQHWKRKKDHNRAEAALIAFYGARHAA